jgi:hypothetical protein
MNHSLQIVQSSVLAPFLYTAKTLKIDLRSRDTMYLLAFILKILLLSLSLNVILLLFGAIFTLIYAILLCFL